MHTAEENVRARSIALGAALLFLDCSAHDDARPLASGQALSSVASLELPPADGGCNLSTFGATDRDAFDAFDARMRSAANSEDPNAFADLVRYPLRVHRNHRTFWIHSREELAKQAANLFTDSVRTGIATQRGFFCIDLGLTYGSGSVWVGVMPGDGGRPERYAISTVNVKDIDPTEAPSRIAPELKIRCIAPEQTVLVEDLGDTLRYQSWRRGEPPTAKPDLLLERGTRRVDGHGPCRNVTYAFDDGDTKYEVSERMCSDNSDATGTSGRLVVSSGGKQIAEWLCSDARGGR